jgi:ribokinase
MNESQSQPISPGPLVVVVGSINMDLVTRVPRLPRPGQTVSGRDFQECPGGKGANQAVAAARLGARCHLIGRVGEDPLGRRLVQSLESHGVDTRGVAFTPGCSSGVALIGVEDGGQNAITIVAGANGRLTPADVDRYETLIGSAQAILLQLEVPFETVVRALELGRRHHVPVVLDPAPAPLDGLPDALWTADVLTPNQSEAELLSGSALANRADAERVARALKQRGPGWVVLKLGEEGALVCDESDRCMHIPAPRVVPVDTTAAGDAFSAAMAVAWSGGLDLIEAVRFACAAGALAVTRPGAQSAMPARHEVESLMLKTPQVNLA